MASPALTLVTWLAITGVTSAATLAATALMLACVLEDNAAWLLTTAAETAFDISVVLVRSTLPLEPITIAPTAFAAAAAAASAVSEPPVLAESPAKAFAICSINCCKTTPPLSIVTSSIGSWVNRLLDCRPRLAASAAL